MFCSFFFPHLYILDDPKLHIISCPYQVGSIQKSRKSVRRSAVTIAPKGKVSVFHEKPMICAWFGFWNGGLNENIESEIWASAWIWALRGWTDKEEEEGEGENSKKKRKKKAKQRLIIICGYPYYVHEEEILLTG